MNNHDLSLRLDFVRKAEKLKETYRSAHTSAGNIESVAEHTWRFLLLLITYADCFPEIDLLRLLEMAVIHDLGEAVSGDIPAPQQNGSKSASERQDFISLLDALPDDVRNHFIDLWDDYESAQSPEAKLAKAFDKVETILQHNQGKNPANFDYSFNLNYGKHYTDAIELTRQIRQTLDKETQSRAEQTSPRTTDNLAAVEIKAFVPAFNYELSKAFYQDIGFAMASDTEGVAYFALGNCSFLLQHTDRQTPAHTMMMHLLVENVDAWHRQLQRRQIASTYHIELPKVTEQPWGMREFILSDPSGVKWRIAQNV